MSTFYDDFFAMPVAERRRVAEMAGLSLPYLHKTIYVHPQREPRFHFHNAVRLDKASEGRLSFLKTTEGDVDWAYVRDRLNSAAVAGQLPEPRKARTRVARAVKEALAPEAA